MLGGLEPIIIFNFTKAVPQVQSVVSTIPVVSTFVDKIGLIVLPIYLSDEITGLFIDTQSKKVSIQTDVETLTSGAEPTSTQKGLSNTITVNLKARNDSIGIMLLSALIDQVFERVTSKEYSVTYFNGAVTVFEGLLQDFSIDESAENDMFNITLEINRGGSGTQPKAAVPQVPKTTGATPTL